MYGLVANAPQFESLLDPSSPLERDFALCLSIHQDEESLEIKLATVQKFLSRPAIRCPLRACMNMSRKGSLAKSLRTRAPWNDDHDLKSNCVRICSSTWTRRTQLAATIPSNMATPTANHDKSSWQAQPENYLKNATSAAWPMFATITTPVPKPGPRFAAETEQPPDSINVFRTF